MRTQKTYIQNMNTGRTREVIQLSEHNPPPFKGIYYYGPDEKLFFDNLHNHIQKTIRQHATQMNGITNNMWTLDHTKEAAKWLYNGPGSGAKFPAPKTFEWRKAFETKGYYEYEYDRPLMWFDDGMYIIQDTIKNMKTKMSGKR